VGWADAPIVNVELVDGVPVPREPELPDAPAVRVEVPEHIQRVKRSSIEEARSWRSTTRRAFLHYMGCGYEVAAFRRERESGRCFYMLISTRR
jgi:predicted GNAT superfamily acetyltransferase